MGAITGTKVYCTEFAGTYKMLTVTATIASESDVITLTEAVHGITAIDGIVGAALTAGADAACMILQVSFSGLAITVASFGEDGLAATDFTGTKVTVTVIGH